MADYDFLNAVIAATADDAPNVHAVQVMIDQNTIDRYGGDAGWRAQMVRKWRSASITSSDLMLQHVCRSVGERRHVVCADVLGAVSLRLRCFNVCCRGTER